MPSSICPRSIELNVIVYVWFFMVDENFGAGGYQGTQTVQRIQILLKTNCHRLEAQNGIALNALHDKAFDRGLITFDTELRLVCSKALKDHFADATVSQSFKAYEGQPLTIPAEAAGPKPEYLEWHRSEVFGK